MTTAKIKRAYRVREEVITAADIARERRHSEPDTRIYTDLGYLSCRREWSLHVQTSPTDTWRPIVGWGPYTTRASAIDALECAAAQWMAARLIETVTPIAQEEV